MQASIGQDRVEPCHVMPFTPFEDVEAARLFRRTCGKVAFTRLPPSPPRPPLPPLSLSARAQGWLQSVCYYRSQKVCLQALLHNSQELFRFRTPEGVPPMKNVCALLPLARQFCFESPVGRRWILFFSSSLPKVAACWMCPCCVFFLSICGLFVLCAYVEAFFVD